MNPATLPRELCVAAAGLAAGEVTFNVHSHQLDGSSLYKETMGSVADGEEVTVPQVRIDDVVKEHGCPGPYLIKIDIQGAELDALDGATEILGDTEVIVLEVSLFEFMKRAPQLDDVIAYMKARGFVTCDLVYGWNRPLDNALGQVYIVFVSDPGALRREHGYARTDQL